MAELIVEGRASTCDVEPFAVLDHPRRGELHGLERYDDLPWQ